jgi:hypothetical protein
MDRDESGELILTKDDVNVLIASGNLYFQHPVRLNKGVYSVSKYADISSYCLRDKEDDEDAEFDEYFTYWELDKDKPLFDIHACKELFNPEIHFTLSDHSLFGMFWLVGNKLSVGMENVIAHLKLDVPNTDLAKYTENNLRKALLDKDFINTQNNKKKRK